MAIDFIIKEEADFEILQAFDYYESKKVTLGLEFLDYLEDYFETLKTEISFFELKRKPSYRELPLKKFPYIIIYSVNEAAIIIYSVFNTNQDPIKKFK